MTEKEIFAKHARENTKFFDWFAPVYNFEKFLFQPIRNKAAKVLALKPSKKILDVATGTGSQALALAKLGHNVTGVDISEGMLRQAKKKIKNGLKMKFALADATKLPFEGNSFDATTVSLALHDMPYAVALAVLKEMKRVTKKGGKIMAVEYMEPNRHLSAWISHQFIKLYETKHYRPFLRRKLKNYFKAANLKIAYEDHFLGGIQYVVAVK